jgi:hypothetical protein
MRTCLNPFLLPLLLLAAGRFPAPGADVSYFGIVKSVRYTQANGASPATLPTNAYVFTAFAVASTNNVLTNATVKPGNTTPLRTLLPTTNQTFFQFEEGFNSQSALDTTYPTTSGISAVNYTMTLSTTNDGIRTASLNFYLLFLALSYPVTPEITNLAAAQTIDTSRDFEIGWNSLGGSSLAIVQLSILDTASNAVFNSPVPFSPGALNGASGSVVIPAYSLPPGASLIGHLSIGNPGLPNTNSYPGATGISSLAKDTQFVLTTRSAPAQPQLQILPPAAGQFRFHVTGDSNRIFQVQASDVLPLWTNVLTTNSASGVFDYADPASPALQRRFYRVRVGQ